MGKMFLILIDAHYEWMNVHTVPSATSHSTISILRTIFTSHGLPEILISNNGTAFISSEFGNFPKAEWDMAYYLSFLPSSN